MMSELTEEEQAVNAEKKAWEYFINNPEVSGQGLRQLFRTAFDAGYCHARRQKLRTLRYYDAKEFERLRSLG